MSDSEKRTEHVNAYIPPSVYRLLKMQADIEQRSLSFIIEKALMAYLSSEEADRHRDLAVEREKCVSAFGPDVIGLDLVAMSPAEVSKAIEDATRRDAVLQR